MGWKQPIDTDIYEWFGEDNLARNLFIHLLLKARNKDMDNPQYYKKKPYKLKRGQVIFGRREYAKLICAAPSSSRNALERLIKVYSKVTSKSNSDYTVINILNFDELVGLEPANKPASNQQVTSDEPAKDTNKKEDLSLFFNSASLKDFFLFLNKKVHSKRLCVVSPEFLSKLRARLKHFTKNDIITAAENMIADPFMNGDNDQNKKYASLSYLLRNDENIRKWIEKAPGKVTRLRNALDVDNLEI